MSVSSRFSFLKMLIPGVYRSYHISGKIVAADAVLFFFSVFILPHHNVLSRTVPVSRKATTFEGDIDMSARRMKSMQNEILFTGKVHPIKTWQDGILPYVISPKFDPVHRELIMDAMKEISGDTCIQFVERAQQKDYLDFVFSKDNRCSSKVGRTGGRQEIQMSPTCMRHGTVVHELLHALGLFHEQSRPDRDKFITIVWENLKTPDSKRNFEKYATQFWRKYNLPYDYGSIMHYSSEAFSKQWGKKTIVPKTDNAPMGQRTAMSHFDQVKINLMYQCPLEE